MCTCFQIKLKVKWNFKNILSTNKLAEGLLHVCLNLFSIYFGNYNTSIRHYGHECIKRVQRQEVDFISGDYNITSIKEGSIRRGAKYTRGTYGQS